MLELYARTGRFTLMVLWVSVMRETFAPSQGVSLAMAAYAYLRAGPSWSEVEQHLGSE